MQQTIDAVTGSGSTVETLGSRLRAPQEQSALASLGWIRSGIQDLLDTGGRGIFYGLVFMLMSFAIDWVYQTLWQATMGLTAGFFLMGPFVCAGLYELSRQREQGEAPNLLKSLFAWTSNWKSVLGFAALLTFIMVVWSRISVLLFALFANQTYPTVQGMINQVVSLQNIEFLTVWAGVGAAFASLVFAVSVVAMPKMMDRQADVTVAVVQSVRALTSSPLACLIWALAIVALVGGAMLIWMPLMLLTAPVVGHASWHAYRAFYPAE